MSECSSEFCARGGKGRVSTSGRGDGQRPPEMKGEGRGMRGRMRSRVYAVCGVTLDRMDGRKRGLYGGL